MFFYSGRKPEYCESTHTMWLHIRPLPRFKLATFLLWIWAIAQTTALSFMLPNMKIILFEGCRVLLISKDTKCRKQRESSGSLEALIDLYERGVSLKPEIRADRWGIFTKLCLRYFVRTLWLLKKLRTLTLFSLCVFTSSVTLQQCLDVFSLIKPVCCVFPKHGNI